MSQAALPPQDSSLLNRRKQREQRFPQTAGFLQMTFSSTSSSLTGPLLSPLSPVELLPLLPLLTSVQTLYPHVASRFATPRLKPFEQKEAKGAKVPANRRFSTNDFLFH